jgi:hypothetical protein
MAHSADPDPFFRARQAEKVGGIRPAFSKFGFLNSKFAFPDYKFVFLDSKFGVSDFASFFDENKAR